MSAGYCKGRIPHPDKPAKRCQNMAENGGLCGVCEKRVKVRKASHRGPGVAATERRNAYVHELEQDLEWVRVFHDPTKPFAPEVVEAVDEAMIRAKTRAERVQGEA